MYCKGFCKTAIYKILIHQQQFSWDEKIAVISQTVLYVPFCNKHWPKRICKNRIVKSKFVKLKHLWTDFTLPLVLYNWCSLLLNLSHKFYESDQQILDQKMFFKWKTNPNQQYHVNPKHLGESPEMFSSSIQHLSVYSVICKRYYSKQANCEIRNDVVCTECKKKTRQLDIISRKKNVSPKPFLQNKGQ